MRKFNLFLMLLIIGLLMTACFSGEKNTSEGETVDPSIRKMEKNKGEVYSLNSRGSKPLPGSQYSYELWTERGNSNRLIWYGMKYGGGAAFRAEWNDANVFLGRVGLFWDRGNPYTYYNDLYCKFKFTRSANGTAGNTSYVGVYGWSKNPMIEWYIVEDWFNEGVIGPQKIGGNAEKMGEFTVDGAVYFIYKATRPAGSGNILGSNQPFLQYFSVRQTTRKSGTISISEHFKEWERVGLALGSNMYEAKFLVEAGSGTGWFEASYLSFYQKGK